MMPPLFLVQGTRRPVRHTVPVLMEVKVYCEHCHRVNNLWNYNCVKGTKEKYYGLGAYITGRLANSEVNIGRDVSTDSRRIKNWKSKVHAKLNGCKWSVCSSVGRRDRGHRRSPEASAWGLVSPGTPSGWRSLHLGVMGGRHTAESREAGRDPRFEKQTRTVRGKQIRVKKNGCRETSGKGGLAAVQSGDEGKTGWGGGSGDKQTQGISGLVAAFTWGITRRKC